MYAERIVTGATLAHADPVIRTSKPASGRAGGSRLGPGDDERGGAMSEPIGSSRFHEVGWRVLAYTEATHFRTGSLAEGAALAEAICAVARTASRQPDIDL